MTGVTSVTPPRQPVLEADHASKEYRPGLVAVRDVTFAAYPGEFIVLIGPSGSGKSTFLHLLGALDRPTGGDIRVEGRSLARASFTERTDFRLSRVGFVFQDLNLLSAFTLRENIELPLILLGWSSTERVSRVDSLAATMGILDCLDRFPQEVSGGQGQRAAVARALAARPVLLIADEPTATLDTVNADQVFHLIRDQVSASGTTAIVATHDTRFLEQADRVLRLVDGVLHEEPGRR